MAVLFRICSEMKEFAGTSNIILFLLLSHSAWYFVFQFYYCS